MKTLKVMMLILGLVIALGCAAEPAEARQVDQVVAQGYSIECNSADSSSGACFLPRYALNYYYDTGNSMQVITFARGAQQAKTLRAYLETYRSYYKPYHQTAETLFLDMGAGDYLADVRMRIYDNTCNNACVDAKIAAFAANYDASFDIMYEDKGVQTKMIAISMYQFLVEEDKLYDSDRDGESNFEEGRRFYQGINAHIKQKAAAHGVEVINLYEAYNGPTGRETTPFSLGMVSKDHVHTSPKGANDIAAKAKALGYSSTTT